MEKRYYWLKFKDDFFDSKRIKKLRKLAGGDTYVIIYLKMQLKALRTDGVLEYTGVESNFADELALDIDENPDDVRVVLAFLLEYKLCECSDNIHYFLPYVVENTGSETANAMRVKAYRERQKALHCNADVMQLKQPCNVEIENREREKSKNSSASHKHPTLEEVQAYIKEKGLNVDGKVFYEYFTTPNEKGETWKDSKGNPVRNWKQKLITWSNKNNPKKKDDKWHPKCEVGGSVTNLDDIAATIDDF